MFGVPKAGQIDYTKSLGLDLATVRPSLAGRSVRRTASRSERQEAVHLAVLEAGRGERLQPAASRCSSVSPPARPWAARGKVKDAPSARPETWKRWPATDR